MTVVFKMQTLEQERGSQNLFLNELGTGDGETQKVVI